MPRPGTWFTLVAHPDIRRQLPAVSRQPALGGDLDRSESETGRDSRVLRGVGGGVCWCSGSRGGITKHGGMRPSRCWASGALTVLGARILWRRGDSGSSLVAHALSHWPLGGTGPGPRRRAALGVVHAAGLVRRDTPRWPFIGARVDRLWGRRKQGTREKEGVTRASRDKWQGPTLSLVPSTSF